MDAIGRLFGGIDAFVRGIRSAVRDGVRGFVDGAGQSLVFGLILGFTGLVILVEGSLRRLDRAVVLFEKVVLSVALLGMTLLAFNEYLQRDFKPLLDTDLGGLWSLPGQTAAALMLFVAVGFFGASLATHEGKHLSVDAIDRVLSPGPARFVRRFVALVSAGLCWVLLWATVDAVYERSHDVFEGAKVWAWLVRPVNFATSLLPGEKYGPGTAFEDRYAWEDAKFETGLDYLDLPAAFPYVEAGDGFPLPLVMMVLVFAFGIMGTRFLFQAIRPKVSDEPVTRRVGTRRPADVVLAGLFPGALIAMALGLWLGTGWLILIASLLLVFLGAPLFVAVGVGTVACWVLIRDVSAQSVVVDMFGVAKQEAFLAIPFFVLAGNLMSQGSMADRLIGFARALLGRLPGGLGVGGVLACAIFAAISGSSPVTVIAIGTMMFPMLLKDGYPEEYSIGMLTSAGGLGIIIPPSIPMIVFAIAVGAIPAVGGMDPAVLFKGGILPGLFIASMLSLYTLYVAWPRPGVDSAIRDDAPPAAEYFSNLLRATGRGALSLMLPILVLGGIYGLFDLNVIGIDFSIAFTVTEAAAVAVVYALVVELVFHRELKLWDLPKVFTESAVMMGSLILIIVIAISLNLFFSFEELPEKATAFMVANVESKFMFLVMLNIFLLLLGMAMDIISAILIVAPLLAPVAISYGIHPIHFGIMFIVNLELGYLTPPMGINLFVSSTVFERPILKVIKSVVPFLFVMLFCLIVIIWVPGLSLFFVE